MQKQVSDRDLVLAIVGGLRHIGDKLVVEV